MAKLWNFERNGLLAALIEADDRSVVHIDADGAVRFAPELTTALALSEQLDLLAATEAWADLVDEHRHATLEAYEAVFGHHAYLGRSGSMHADEGIGSIYWHMVTKLLLAVQEALATAVSSGAPEADVERLVAAYWRVRGGLGVNKSAEEFGAVPIDPYSHTPAHAGAQQPGMTGAVKEEILARPRELGVRVEEGQVAFDGVLVRAAELLDAPATWIVRSEGGREVVVDLAAGALGLTFCQVPIIVSSCEADPSVEVVFADGRTERHEGDRLDRPTSAAVFGRTGVVEQIRATVRIDALAART